MNIKIPNCKINKEIGSYFYTNLKDIDNELSNKVFEDKNLRLYSTGRCAIRKIIDIQKLNGKCVLLPIYTCESVIQPFKEANCKVHFYDINKDLTVQTDRLMDLYRDYNPDAFLMHSYFGFPTYESCVDIIDYMRNKGTTIINDLTQSLFTKATYIKADFYLGSIRKWCEVMDGAFLYSNTKSISNDANIENKELISILMEAYKKKYDYIYCDSGEKVNFLQLFHNAEECIENSKEIHTMSKISKQILNGIDLDRIKAMRYKNYSFLLNALKTSNIVTPVFDTISEGIVPLYFPVYCNNQKELQKYLGQSQIYAPVIWPISNYVKQDLDEESKSIYNSILAIPCDQRYTVADMKYIVKKINELESMK